MQNTDIGLYLLDLQADQLEYSPALAGILCGNPHLKLNRADFIKYLHPDDELLRQIAFQEAMRTGKMEYYPRVIWEDGSVHHIRVSGLVHYDPSGQPIDISGAVILLEDDPANRLQQTIENRLRSMVQHAPVAMLVIWGEEMIFDVVNEAMLTLLNLDAVIIGKPLRAGLPDTEQSGIWLGVQAVYRSGEPFYAPEIPLYAGKKEPGYYSFSYTPLKELEKTVGVLLVAVDVTAQVMARKKLEDSELFAHRILLNSPVAKIVFTGEEMILSVVNEKMLELLGRDNSIVGRPFMEAMPELLETPIMDRLRRVLHTGEDFHSAEEKFILHRFGQPTVGYYNYTCKALRNTDGEIYGIINTAVEVTEQVIARQKVMEAEEALRGAIELAELGTWSIDLETGLLTYSDRLLRWFGFENNGPITIEQAYSGIAEKDWPLVKAAMTQAITPGTDGIYDVEYRVFNRKAGVERILHAQGKAVVNDMGVAYKVNGTAQDVTEQRQTQLALERLVQERTEELASSNEELLVTNEELAKANNHLLHSNEELAQYAYVASHDLQEPLRKIRIFSGLLSEQSDLSEENARLVEKINQSSERMSMLIEDLLEFSRLLNSDELVKPVDLGVVCQSVVRDFELAIAEKGAVVHVGHLPVIQAVALQMNQLFYNLLSNALKFVHPDRSPFIRIHSRFIDRDEVRSHIPHPDRFSNYYHLTFADNGIGFEQKYNEHIFEVFKRLHGRETYPGTGIGLALCRRIAANQRGHLFATSVPGEGTVFHIILPDM